MENTIQKMALSICNFDWRIFRIIWENVPSDTKTNAILNVIVIMMRFTDAFKVFDTIYTMTNGGPGTATEMLPNFIYKQGLKYYDAGYAAALAIVFVLLMALITLFFLRLRKKEEENVW